MEPSVYDLTYNDLNPRFLFCCNLLRTEPEMNYHCHDFIEFAIILKGKTTFRIDEQLYDVEEGSVILLNPGTYHQSLPTDGTSVREFYLAFSNVEFTKVFYMIQLYFFCLCISFYLDFVPDQILIARFWLSPEFS